MHYRYNLSPHSRVPHAQVRSKKFFLKEATQFYMFYCFIYIQNKWNFLKTEMHVYKLSLCTYNHFLGLLQHFVSSCSHVWEKIKVLYLVSPDFIGYGNSLSTIVTFFFFLTRINYVDCTWTDSRVSWGTLLSAFLSIGNDYIQNTAYIG